MSVSKAAYKIVLGAAAISTVAFGAMPKCNAVGIALLAFRFGGYFVLYGAFATFIRWLLMVPPQRTPTPKEVARAVAAGAPIAPIDPRMLLSAQQMSQDLRAGKYTSVELVELFIAHIERVDRRAVNAVVGRRFDEARAEARRADEILADARAGRRDWATVGWLTGVPCSIKECYALTGMPNCVGHPMRAPGAPPSAAESTEAYGFQPSLSKTDAPAVARLRAAGAIPLGVTNTSELCMWLESNNRVYGTTCNPYDASRLVGGSSGGEAAAVSAVYAPFGLGSDIGGSIRLPSMFCGTFGHKPSTRLVPNRGQMPGVRDRGHNILVSGPITRHADDLWPLMQTLVDGGFLENPALARFPLPPSLEEQLAKHAAEITKPSDIVLDSSVTVYAVEDMNLPGTSVSAEQRAAVRATAARLEAAYGCKIHVVDWRRPETVPPGWIAMRAALKYWNACMNQDQNTYVTFLEAGYNASPLDIDARGPGTYRVFGELAKWFTGRSRHTFPSVALGALETLEKRFLSKSDLSAHVAESDALSHAISHTLGLKGVMICPGFPHVAAKHHALKLLSLGFTYTALFNALQLPVTSVPVWHSQDAKAQRLPCGVQVVGAYGNDVMTLCVAEGLARATPDAHQCKVPQWMTVGTAAKVAA